MLRDADRYDSLSRKFSQTFCILKFKLRKAIDIQTAKISIFCKVFSDNFSKKKIMIFVSNFFEIVGD